MRVSRGVKCGIDYYLLKEDISSIRYINKLQANEKEEKQKIETKKLNTNLLHEDSRKDLYARRIDIYLEEVYPWLTAKSLYKRVTKKVSEQRIIDNKLRMSGMDG